MASLSEERYCFNLDWYDDQAAIIRKYSLNYFVTTNMIEMYDVKNARIFLKKIEVPGIQLEDFFVGAQITILARVLKVTDYGDVRTRKAFEQHRAKTFAMIKPHAYSNFGKIIDSIYQSGFEINKLKMSKFSKETAAGFYAEHVGKSYY